MCSLFSITRLRSEPSRTMMDVTRDLIALTRPYFSAQQFSEFSAKPMLSPPSKSLKIIAFILFYFILFLICLQLASLFQVAIGIDSRGCVGEMLLFVYYFCSQTKCLILWISDSLTFVCVTVILAIALSLSLRPWLFLHFSGDAWTRPALAWPTAIIEQTKFNDSHVTVFSS